MENQESYMTIHHSDHNTSSNNFHSINHFPTNTFEDSCSTLVPIDPINLYDSSFDYLGTFHKVEKIYFLLRVMSVPHDLDKVPEQDHIKFPYEILFVIRVS